MIYYYHILFVNIFVLLPLILLLLFIPFITQIFGRPYHISDLTNPHETMVVAPNGMIRNRKFVSLCVRFS